MKFTHTYFYAHLSCYIFIWKDTTDIKMIKIQRYIQNSVGIKNFHEIVGSVSGSS